VDTPGETTKQPGKALAETSRRLIEAQEQERARIPRELHDDIGQRLALSICATDLMQQSINEPPEKLLGIIRQLHKELTEAAELIRVLAHDLHSSRLEFLDLGTAMKSLCKEFSERLKIRIKFTQVDLPQPLPPEISLCLFRVLQEALNNAGKHSHASFIDVKLRGTPIELHLVIADTGVGFDVSEATLGHGLGLTAIQERVRLLHGTVLIRSKPGAGTVVHACVPYRAKENVAKTLHAKP
jgi:signal transduction histidine kinase